MNAPLPPVAEAPLAAGHGRARSDLVFIVAAAVVIAALACYRLRAYPYPLDLVAAVRGAATTARSTVPAAITVWLIVGVALLGLAAWLRRREPDFSAAEATAGALVLLWAAAYLLLLALGPIGLFRPAVLRGLLIALLVVTLRSGRHRRPAVRPVPEGPPQETHAAARRFLAGTDGVDGSRAAWIAAIAIALCIIPLLLMQIGSPVSPFMDVLPLIAGVQKIVTFQLYDPFHNDASGLVALGRGSVGYEAPFSLLALIAGLSGPMAMTALIVPCAVLQVFALAFLGRVVQGSLAGGMATLFLLQTFAWRRTPDIRGTTLAFALVAIGIAFLCGARRGGTRTALGGLALGTAVTVNPLIGAVGMQVAAVCVVAAWLDLGTPLVGRVAALAAGSTFALPQVFVGTGRQAPLWILPLIAAAGVLLMVGARAIAARPERRRRRASPLVRVTILVVVPLAVLVLHARRQSEFFGDDWFGYELLALWAVCGLVVAAREVWRRPARWPAATVPALAVAIGIVNYAVASPRRFAGPPELRSLAAEVTSKMMYYWTPYWLALGAGIWFAILARRWAYGPAVALVLLLVVYPLRTLPGAADYEGSQLSLAETWGFHLAHAANGYHAGQPDRRWVLDKDWQDLAHLMLDEVAAGRVGYYTHILQIAPSINSVEMALGTGISVDLIAPQGSDPGNLWLVGTRVHGLDGLQAAFAARPRYVLVDPWSQFPELAAYDELMVRPLFRLYRLKQ